VIVRSGPCSLDRHFAFLESISPGLGLAGLNEQSHSSHDVSRVSGTGVRCVGDVLFHFFSSFMRRYLLQLGGRQNAMAWKAQEDVEDWLANKAQDVGCDLLDAELAGKLGKLYPRSLGTPCRFEGHSQCVLNTDTNLLLADAEDTVGRRDQFNYPVVDPEVEDSPPCVYLCGNSLGLQPVNAVKYVNEEMQRWSRGGVRGHFEGAGRCKLALRHCGA
jgi:hypothetical protein